MESDANWWLDSPDGVEIGGSGISATLRDYARFGQFILEDGVVSGDSILPARLGARGDDAEDAARRRASELRLSLVDGGHGPRPRAAMPRSTPRGSTGSSSTSTRASGW